MSKVTKNYNKDYFNWYKNIGEFGAIMNHEKFQQHISYNDSVLDFGCGGGYLLEKIFRPIILTAIYVFIIFPTFLYVKIFKKDMMQIKFKKKDTYWKDSEYKNDMKEPF